MAGATGVLSRRIGCGELNDGDDPAQALRETVEWVAPVWPPAEEVDWAWLVETEWRIT